MHVGSNPSTCIARLMQNSLEMNVYNLAVEPFLYTLAVKKSIFLGM